MTYGLKVFAGNNIIQVDSDLSVKGLQVVQSATGSSLSSLPLYTDLVFMKRAPTASYICLERNYGTGVANFRIGSTGALINVDYIVCRASTDASISGTYGLKVFNPSGVVSFESRGFTANNGVAIVNNVVSRSLTNGSLISDDLTQYVLMNWTYYTNTSNFAGVSVLSGGYYFARRVNGSFTGTNTSEIPLAEIFN